LPGRLLPIGYIQIYNLYAFARAKPLIDLPKSLAAIDLFIGEKEYLGQGFAAEILKQFDYQNFEYILVDPDINNIAAIKTYEKAGFNKFKEHADTNEIWMIKTNL
jgi:RimJ/RimL family protein N-acetyltransferase